MYPTFNKEKCVKDMQISTNNDTTNNVQISDTKYHSHAVTTDDVPDSQVHSASAVTTHDDPDSPDSAICYHYMMFLIVQILLVLLRHMMILIAQILLVL